MVFADGVMALVYGGLLMGNDLAERERCGNAAPPHLLTSAVNFRPF
jgi:hypothetical protein